MDERRRFVRLDTRLEVSYSVLPSGKMEGASTKDISGSGVCLFTNQVLPAGTHLQVSMKLPDRDKPVNFTAEVVWSEAYEVIGKTERRRAAETGVRFLEVSPQDQDAVMQHVILSLKS